MKRYLPIILLGLFSQVVLAQSKSYLEGKTFDGNRLPISAYLQIAGTSIYTYSNDTTGKFRIEVPANQEFTVQMIFSKETKVVKFSPQPEGKTVYRDFRFTKTSSIGPVEINVVTDEDRSIIKLDPKETVRFVNPGDYSQVLKGTMIGISKGGSELSSAYSVRGGNYDENLVYVNDIEVYRPFLVRSGQQEGLSIINPDLIDNIEFSAGGFQAKYGDKLSSVLDIQYTDPDSFRATVQGSFLGANVHFEDKSKDRRFSYLVGARYRSNQYLLGSLDVQADYKPRFFDVQALLKYRITADLSLSYLSTISQNTYLVAPQSRQTSFGNVNSALSLFVAFGGQELMEYRTLMNGLNLEYKPDPSLDLKLNVSSYLSTEREHFTVEGAYRLSELDNNPGSNDFASEKALLGIGYFIDHARNDLRAQVYSANHKGRYLFKNSKLQWGVGFTSEAIEDRLKEWRYNDSSEYNITTSAATRDSNEIVLDEYLSANISLNSYRAKAYVQNTQLLNKEYNVKTTYGIRTNYWSYNNENVISPRGQLAWEPNKKFNDSIPYNYMDTTYNRDSLKKRDWLLRFATGYYYQPPFYRELRRLDGTLNPNLKAQKSIHFVFGGDLFFKAWNRPFKFTGEAYYKHLDNMIPYVVDNVRIRYLAENSSQGYATGIDTRVNGEFIQGIESWLNFSLLQTKERIYFTDDDGNEQLSDWLRRPTDQRVNFSILFQDELPSNPSYKLNLSLVYGGRVPFFFDGNNREKGGFTIPPYRRVDIGFSKVLVETGSHKRPTWMKNAESLWMSLEVFNLLQVNNTISYVLVKDFQNNVFGVPNYLTGRRLNLRFILKI